MAASSTTFDVSAPALVLAPHLRYPTRNGADIYADRVSCALSQILTHVDVLAESSFVRYEKCKETSREIFRNAYRSRNMAALRTLFKRGHFYREKFVTPAFAKRGRALVETGAYGTVVCSYIATASMLNLDNVSQRVLALTHNDEFRWFHNLADAASIPGARSVALRSSEWLEKYLRENADHLALVHVTDEDRIGYENRIPAVRHAIAPVGVDLPGVTAAPLDANAQSVTLLFAGSLGVQMNFDALVHFAEKFFPVLASGLRDDLEVVVVGSSPTTSVRTLVDSKGWQLREDVPEHVLEDLYLNATFAILPFPYATGAKLKLLKALSYGVPVLSTPVLAGQQDLVRSPGLMSDDPSAWLSHIRNVRSGGITAEERGRLRSIAAEHSWARSVSLLTGVDTADT